MGGKKEKYLIALAGLFHDIGKFYWRATGETTSPEEKKSLDMLMLFYLQNGLKKQKNIFEKVEKGLTAKLINWGAKHHN
ncbi:MAG: hypothetical protein Q9M89_01590, partial [Persephonella sp.]|nr:hypothetical protein [Persephonella sp.]